MIVGIACDLAGIVGCVVMTLELGFLELIACNLIVNVETSVVTAGCAWFGAVAAMITVLWSCSLEGGCKGLILKVHFEIRFYELFTITQETYYF